jgi:hypothetical protein
LSALYHKTAFQPARLSLLLDFLEEAFAKYAPTLEAALTLG